MVRTFYSARVCYTYAAATFTQSYVGRTQTHHFKYKTPTTANFFKLVSFIESLVGQYALGKY